MDIQKFKHNDWTKIYEGRWSFLTTSHFSDEYTKEILFGGKPFKSQSISFISNGFSSGWMRQSDRDKLGQYLSEEIHKSPRKAREISNNLKLQAKLMLDFMDKNVNTVATLDLYNKFWKMVPIYYHPHINVKYVVDYLTPNLLDKYLSILQEARLVAEPVLNRTEEFMINFVKLLSKEAKYPYNLLLCLTKEELYDYYSSKKLPLKDELEKRDKKAAILSDKKNIAYYVSKDVEKIEKIANPIKDTTHVKGSAAYKGKVRGVVRIVLDPRKAHSFNKGDILITGATRPDYIPIMKKAGAFVTDAGGILSHAAITAREMKKPCVIGTQRATKVFMNGDVVEVDADKGLVKKI